MEELKEIKKQINRYVNRVSEEELHETLYRAYEIMGWTGLKDFVSDFKPKFPLSWARVEKIVYIEKTVTAFLPRSEYPHINNNLRKKIYESKNREIFINRIRKGEEINI